MKNFNDLKKETKKDLKRKIESVSDILKKEVKEQPFVLQGMIPEGAITALTADVGKGKSLFMMKAIQAISNGEKLFNTYETKKKKILVLDLEMSEYDITARVHSILQEPSDISFYCQSFQIDDESDYKWLVKIIKDNEFEMLIIDTLNSAHGKEENSASEMRNVNRKLLSLIDETGITILYLHHHRKLQQGERYGQASSRGSTEILAKVASHLLLDSRKLTVADDNGIGYGGLHLMITQYKSRLAEGLKQFGVDVWYNNVKKKTYWQYTGEIDEENTMDMARGFILNTIQEKEEWSIKDLLAKKEKKQFRFCESNLRNAIKELQEIGKIKSKKEGGNKNLYYLPDKTM